MNANLSSLGANRGGGAVVAGVSAGYQTIEDYPQYEMQIPDDYAAPTIIEEAPNFRIQWQGQQRDNGSAPQLQVTITESTDGSTPSVDELIAERSQELESQFDGFSATAPDSFNAQGIAFSRIAWGGTQKSTSRPVQGFTYAAVDSGLAIIIDYSDESPDADQTTDSAHAAAESFRRTP